MSDRVQIDEDSARWSGSDLRFDATIDGVERQILIKGHRLQITANRDAVSVARYNLPAFTDLLVQTARDSGPALLVIN